MDKKVGTEGVSYTIRLFFRNILFYKTIRDELREVVVTLAKEMLPHLSYKVGPLFHFFSLNSKLYKAATTRFFSLNFFVAS